MATSTNQSNHIKIIKLLNLLTDEQKVKVLNYTLKLLCVGKEKP